MAGDAFSRFKTQVLIFFSVTVKKKFDTSTREGRVRLGYFVALLCLLLVAVVALSDTTTETQVTIRTGGLGGESRALMFDDEDEDAEDGAGEDDGEENEDDDSEGEEENEKSSSNPVVNALKSAQQSRQAEMKGSFGKFFESYKYDEDIAKFIKSYEEKYQSLGIIRSTSIGKTYEKRDIMAYTIGKSKAKKHVIVLGSEHGCEWSVPMYLTYVVTRLVQLYGINEEVTQVLDKVQLHIVPQGNPDGAAYTLSGKAHDARHYMKNRAPVRKHSSTKGVDLREDWSHFTQLETKAVKQYMQDLKTKGNLAAFVSVQCCGSSVAAPRNATCIHPEALEEQESVGKQIAREMKITNPFSFYYHLKPIKHSKIHSDDFSIHWAQNSMGLNLAYTLSAAPASPDPSSKQRKKVTKVIISEKKLIEIPERDLLIGSREITKGVVALGRHLAESSARHPSALCGSPAEPEPKEEEEEEEGGEEGEGEQQEMEESHAGEDEDEEEPQAEGEDDEERDEDAHREEEDDESEEDEREDNDAEEAEEEEGQENQLSKGDHEEDEEEEGEEVAEHPDEEVLSEDSDPSMDMAKRFARRQSVPSKRSSSSSSSLSSSTSLSSDREGFHEGKDDMANSLRFARKVNGVGTPILENIDPSTLDGSGDYFLYFAYGPDMLYELLYSSGITSAKKVVNAQLDGFGFDYTYFSKKVWKSGVADIYKKRGGHVLGVIYRVDKSQRAMLDRHNLAAHEESHVAPVTITVHDTQGNSYEVLTYRVPLKMPGDDIAGKYRRFKPSRQYRNCVIKGAKQHHFPEDYIEKRLRSISALYSDKIGSTAHRNPAIGTLCDVHT